MGELILVQGLNGLTLAMVLFMVSAGLSITYGLMRILNLAHGAFYVIGTYVALAALREDLGPLRATFAGLLITLIVGFVVFRGLLVHVKEDELGQILLTLGVTFILSDLALLVWGGTPINFPIPEALSGSMTLLGLRYPVYRFFVMVFAIVVNVALWWTIERTRVGALVRAGVDDAGMAAALGIQVRRIATAVFCGGVALAALGGILGAPMIGLYPAISLEILLLAMIVIIVGGLGSIKGAFLGAIVVAMIDTFSKAFIPEIAAFALSLPMLIILVFKPRGLVAR